VFTSQPYVRYRMCSVAEARRIWQTVIDGVKGLGEGHHLVAKLHPAEDVEWTRRWLGDTLPAEWTLTRDDDVLSLVFQADALITVISTTALEAMYLEKPVVLLDASDVKQPIPYIPSGAALQVRTAAELTLRLKEALYDEGVRARLAQARRAFVPKQLDIADGKASERVADLIRTIVGA
ncbi:MAG: CDP-glycerol glycerophosphotransferase family protein, partial [Anaerolineae bacterium]